MDKGLNMKFCKKCGAIMMPKKEGSKTVMACTQCSYKDKEAESMEIKETVEHKDKVEVIDQSEEDQVMPLVDQKCEKCGHPKSYFWTVQTRASDEPETKFYKCEKCRHTWRDYS